MRIPPAAVAAGGILSSKGMEKIGWIPLPVKGAGSDAASARLRHAAGNFLKLGGNVPVIVPPVGKSTAGTVFHTALGIGEISPAVGSQGVERAVAEQTVKILRVVGGVAGEIFARPVTASYAGRYSDFGVQRGPRLPGVASSGAVGVRSAYTATALCGILTRLPFVCPKWAPAYQSDLIVPNSIP